MDESVQGETFEALFTAKWTISLVTSEFLKRESASPLDSTQENTNFFPCTFLPNLKFIIVISREINIL